MDYLPRIKMDFIPDDSEIEIDEKVENEKITKNDKNDKNDPKTQETDPNFIYDEELVENTAVKSGENDAEVGIKAVVVIPKNEKEEIVKDDIFDMPVKLKKNGQPRKKRPPMTEEHKAKMKAAREKKQKEKREAQTILKQEKDLLRKKKVKDVTALKEEIENPKPKPPPKKEINIEQAVMDGIMKYETIRKQRKSEKKKVQQEEAEKKKLQDTLLRAVRPQKNNNPYANCY